MDLSPAAFARVAALVAIAAASAFCAVCALCLALYWPYVEKACRRCAASGARATRPIGSVSARGRARRAEPVRVEPRAPTMLVSWQAIDLSDVPAEDPLLDGIGEIVPMDAFDPRTPGYEGGD